MPAHVLRGGPAAVASAPVCLRASTLKGNSSLCSRRLLWVGSGRKFQTQHVTSPLARVMVYADGRSSRRMDAGRNGSTNQSRHRDRQAQKDLPQMFESMPSSRSTNGKTQEKGSHSGRHTGSQGRGIGRKRAGSKGGNIKISPRDQPQDGKQSMPEIPIMRMSDDRTATSTDFFSEESWKTAGANTKVAEVVKSLGFLRPSHVQAESFKQLSSGRQHAIIADRAGSGKTLAYLLPLVQLLRDEEFEAKSKGISFSLVPKSPRVIIVAPTEELVLQVRRVLQALARAGLPLKSTVATGGHKYRSQRMALQGGVDIVIATPGRALQHIEDGNIDLGQCKAMVLDEVDVLLSPASTFRDEVIALRAKSPKDMRFVMATATLPHSVYIELLEEFPFLEVFQGPGLHRNPPGVIEQLVDCSGGDEVTEQSGFLRKSDALVNVLQKNKEVDRTIVFCNKIETCRAIENLLNRRNECQYKVLPYHAALSDAMRQRCLQEFLAAPDADDTPKVLVCTDRASRGVDSIFVEHVVLFDFPRDPSEYVRRVGRTARGAGNQGFVTSLVLGRQVGLATNIINRNQRGIPIHKVPMV